MAISFDFANSLINISIDQPNLAIQDLINAIRTVEASEKGIAYGKIANAEGKTDLGNGVAVGISITLLGSWQLKFAEGNYIASVTGGNLVGGLGGDPIAYSAGVQTLLIQSAASTVVTTNGAIPTAAEIATEVVNKDISLTTNGSLGDIVNKANTNAQNAFVVSASKI